MTVIPVHISYLSHFLLM